MAMMIFFSVTVLYLGVAAQQAVCERYHIVSSPSDPCPGERNGEFCFTLQQFVSASLSVGRQHLTLELEPGIHALESQFSITGIGSIEIIGHNATINCSRYYFSRYLFNFQTIEQVSISGITFIDCHRIYLNTVYNATISWSKFDTRLRPLSYTGLDLRTTNVTIDSCTFVGHSTGVYLYYSPSSINSCNFFGNRRGMYLSYSNATVFNCTLRANRISNGYGSAIYIYSSSLLITQSSFINNSASNRVYGGGAIYMSVYYFTRIESFVTIDRCIFANNTAYQGGAIYIDTRSQIYISQPLNCAIYGSVFINNNAIYRGGAISAADNVSMHCG
jgi:parallel beta-helix repeat protein/predicted outer membrane repeat protein